MMEGLSVEVGVRVDLESLADWPDDKRRALLSGIAKVLSVGGAEGRAE